MPRYARISPESVKLQDRIRLTRHNTHGEGGEVVFTGPVIAIHREPRVSVLDTSKLPDRVTAFELPGDVIAHVRSINGWECASIEIQKPELPATLGSIILIQLAGHRRAAALQETSYSDSPSRLFWCWTDNGEEVAHELLDSAEILYRA